MKVKFLLTAVMLLVSMIGIANAQVANLPEAVSFKEMPVELQFDVFNEKSTKEKLDVQFFIVGYEFLQKPEFIAGKKMEKVKVRLLPRPEISEGEYESKVIVRVGNEETIVPITFDFRELNECPVEFGIVKKKAEEKSEKQEIEIRMKNKSVKTADVIFNGISGLPSTWQYTIDKKSMAITALNDGSMKLTIIPTVDYDGIASLNFDCEGFKHSENITIKGKSAEGAKVVGFATFGNVFGGGTNEILIDVVLALFAAVLLIAFIARYVKRYPSNEFNRAVEDLKKLFK